MRGAVLWASAPAASDGAVVSSTAKSALSCRVAPLLLAAVLMVAVPIVAGTAPMAFAKEAVVLNSDDDSLSVIDTTTYKETSRSYIGRAPHHLMKTPDGKSLI
ncbi:MAG TPA: hypothetical protein VNF99_09615, partial [Stellaceae bacterium]|nr:hypothetical protein [Stellaceae bacterium]